MPCGNAAALPETGADAGPTPAARGLSTGDLRRELDQAFGLVGEIRDIFEDRRTYVLHTLLDLVAVELNLLMKEQGGRYAHSESDIAEAYSEPPR